MNNIWIISDSHFNHRKIFEYEDRPQDYNQQITRKIRNNLGPKDVLVHLGDVIFDRPSELNKYLEEMGPCIKVLVKGNHDKSGNQFYYNKGFHFVVDEFRIGNFVFTHIPKRDLSDEQINVHGHLHRNSHHISEYTDTPERYICYSPEVENYMPIRLKDLIIKNKKKLLAVSMMKVVDDLAREGINLSNVKI